MKKAKLYDDASTYFKASGKETDEVSDNNSLNLSNNFTIRAAFFWEKAKGIADELGLDFDREKRFLGFAVLLNEFEPV